MSRLKFEEQFRAELKDREIKPSAGSWEQLEEKLKKGSEKTSGVVFWWTGIAASMVAGVLIWNISFQGTAVEAPAIVDAPSEEIESFEEIPIETQPVVLEEMQAVERKQEKKTVGKPVERSLAGNRKKEKSVLTLQKENPVVFEEVVPAPELAGIIAEVPSKEEETGEVTDAEIDALLAKAAGNIHQEKSGFAGNTDAGILLYEVEMELEQSFREKVFEVLKEGFQKTRTAVANKYQ